MKRFVFLFLILSGFPAPAEEVMPAAHFGAWIVYCTSTAPAAQTDCSVAAGGMVGSDPNLWVKVGMAYEPLADIGMIVRTPPIKEFSVRRSAHVSVSVDGTQLFRTYREKPCSEMYCESEVLLKPEEIEKFLAGTNSDFRYRTSEDTGIALNIPLAGLREALAKTREIMFPGK